MKMLIPLDGSKFSEEVLHPAQELAACSDAEVHLLEVVNESYAQTEHGHGNSYGWTGGGASSLLPKSVDVGLSTETRTRADERI